MEYNFQWLPIEPLAPLPRLSNFQVELITFQRPKCYANASIRRVLRVLATLIRQFLLTCSSDDKSRGSGGLSLSRMTLFELADPTVVVVPAVIVVVVMVIVVADTKMFPEQEEAEPPDAWKLNSGFVAEKFKRRTVTKLIRKKSPYQEHFGPSYSTVFPKKIRTLKLRRGPIQDLPTGQKDKKALHPVG